MDKLIKPLRSLSKNVKLIRILLFILITTLSASRLPAQTGIITGTIVDSKTGEALIGVNIFIESTTIGSATDLDGNYRISSIPSGSYTVIASMVGYSKVRITDVKVKEDEFTKLDISLTPEAFRTEEVVITARMLQDSEASLLKMRQKSNSISDAISAELISRSGSSNAADAMTKVTGVSVVGGKYVYVRGLGDRYSSTHLNGSELPSSDPDKKAFNMDLFPSGVLDNIVTVKTFTPDKPGNFSGGIVDIGTKSYPEKLTLKLSTSSSYNTISTFNHGFLTYSGGKSDWLGMDDGSREIPQVLKDPQIKIPSPASARTNKELAEKLDLMSKAFTSQMSPRIGTAPINQSYSFLFGDQTKIVNMPLGFLTSLTYGREYSFYENGTSGRWKLTGDVNSVESLTELQYLNDSKGTDEVNWGGLVTLNLIPDPEHEIGANFIYTQSGQSNARFLYGRWLEQFNEAPDVVLETRVLSYTERNLKSYQLNGRHVFNSLAGLRFNWKANLSRSTQKEPDTRYFTDHYANGNYSISGSIYPLPSRYFRNMNEDSKGVNLDLIKPLEVWNSLSARFKAGAAYNKKERVFTERRFQYSLGSTRYNGQSDFFFSPENSGIVKYDSLNNRYSFGNTISESPDPRGGNYNGSEEVTAFYGMIELPVTTSLKFIGGVRYEIARMQVFGRDTRGFLYDKDLLPSLNLIYQLTENMNLRASYGRTLARPNFREKAPYANYNFSADYIFVGNPSLERTLIDNYDLRWEWFLRPGEIIALSGFYKNFMNPIERVINVFYSSEGGEVFYKNIDRAEVRGIELEVRKRLDEVFDELSSFSVGANISLISSQVEIAPEELAVIKQVDPDRKSTRQLQGQSPYIINIDLSYENHQSGTYLSLFYNVFGDRLAEVSTGGTPDVFERSRPMLDLTASQNLLSNFNLKFSIKNIFNSKYKLSQEFKAKEYIRTEYEMGTSVSFGIGYSLN